MIEKEIYFITGNPHKVLSLQKALSSLPHKTIQCDLNITETQRDTIQDIASDKARQAFALLKKPLIVNDSGLVIPILNNFPGPYTKYFTNVIGNQGIIKLLENMEDREAYMAQTLVYIDIDGREHIFEDKVMGHISSKEDNSQNPRAWGNIWKIFIPLGAECPLSSLSEEDYHVLRKGAQIGSVWNDIHNLLAGECQ